MPIQSNCPVPPELARHEASKFKPDEAHIFKFRILCSLLDITFPERMKVDNLLPNIDMQVASQIDQFVEWYGVSIHIKDVGFCVEDMKPSILKSGEAHISNFEFLCALLDVTLLVSMKVDYHVSDIDVQVASWIDQLAEMIWCMHSKDVAFCILLCTSIHINE